MISPSLSDIAHDLGFKDSERDLYIGSYMQVAYAVVSLPLSMVAGVLTDHYNRTRLLMVVVIFGGLSMIGFATLNSYNIMLFLRVVHGVTYGASVPLTYSLMSDLCGSSVRAKMSAYLTVSQGAGTLVGQLFVGYMSPLVNWRMPFLLVGGLTLLQGAIIPQCIVEPERGATDDNDDAKLSSELTPLQSSSSCNGTGSGDGSTPPPPSIRGRSRRTSLPSPSSPPPLISRDAVMVVVHMLQIPTVALMLAQAVPNNIPWGMLSVHMNDFLLSEGNLPAAEATSLIAVFGAGAGLGGVGGGALGNYLYSISKANLPIFMGLTSIGSAFTMQLALHLCVRTHMPLLLNSTIIGISGALAAVNGSLNRAVLLNVTSPYARGVAMSSLTVINSLGRGFGPAALTSVMHTSNVSRMTGMERLLYLWVLAGVLLLLIAVFLGKDEERMKAEAGRRHVQQDDDDDVLDDEECLGGAGSAASERAPIIEDSCKDCVRIASSDIEKIS